MPAATRIALVGAVGGAGTTRTAVELAATLARDGRRVAVLDASLATQGLADYVEGRIDPDLTRLLTDGEASSEERVTDAATTSVRPETTLENALYTLDIDASGEVVCLPTHAPFERLARAQTPEAARTFEHLVDETAERVDAVIVDVAPVASNVAIAAVTCVDRVSVVTPATPRGQDAVPRTRDRLADLGVEAHAVVSTRGVLPGANATIPEIEGTDDAPVADAPAVLSDDTLTAAFVSVASATGRWSLDLDLEPGGVVEQVRKRLERRAD